MLEVLLVQEELSTEGCCVRVKSMLLKGAHRKVWVTEKLVHLEMQV